MMKSVNKVCLPETQTDSQATWSDIQWQNPSKGEHLALNPVHLASSKQLMGIPVKEKMHYKLEFIPVGLSGLALGEKENDWIPWMFVCYGLKGK